MHEILLPSSRLTRFRNAYRHQAQARFVAAIPVLRRRVPARGLWRRAAAVRAAAMRLRPASLPATRTAAVDDTVTRRSTAAVTHARLPLFAAGIAIGAVSMYYLDVDRGRRRRALVRDRLVHLSHLATRRVRTVERRGRFVRGIARGVAHDATELVLHGNGRGAPVDDETLVARVRSEALRGRDVKAGEIRIDAYDGCVTLRGQLERTEEIERLVDAAKHVDGVREVRSYLHLPDTPPPNKADVYTRVPAHLTAGA